MFYFKIEFSKARRTDLLFFQLTQHLYKNKIARLLCLYKMLIILLYVPEILSKNIQKSGRSRNIYKKKIEFQRTSNRALII